MKFTALRKKVMAATVVLGLLSFATPQQASACVTGWGICVGSIGIGVGSDGSVKIEISLHIGVEG